MVQWSMILFFLLFFGIFFGMHGFVYWKINQYLGLKHPLWLKIAIVVLAISLPISMALERNYQHNLFEGYYFLASAWLAIVFMLFMLFLAADLLLFAAKLAGIGIKFSVIQRTLGIGILLFTGILALGGMVYATTITTKTYEIYAPITNPVTIAHWSDVHLGALHKKGHLEKIVQLTNQQQPDLVVITGDLFDGSGHVNEEMLSPINMLTAPQGVYFITGNHENYYGLENVMRLLSTLKLQVLRNEIKKVGELELVGIDYPLQEGQRTNLVLATLSKNMSATAIVLYHAPLGIQEFEQSPAILQLSGHTHRGQIFPFNLLVNAYYKYPYGKHQVKENKWIIVSSGLGTWGPRMRTFSSNELVIIKILPSQ